MSDQFTSVTPAPASDKKGLAIASLVLGILGFCGALIPVCGGLFGLAGVVLGFLGLKSSGKGMAIAGIVLGVLGILAAIVIFIIGLSSGPIFESITDALQTGY